MTLDEAMAWAKSVQAGGAFKKSEVAEAVSALLAGCRPVDTSIEIDGQPLPQLGFSIEKTGTGIHVPREANRAFSRQEAMALMVAIGKALEP